MVGSYIRTLWLPCLGTNQVASCSQKVSLAPKKKITPKITKKECKTTGSDVRLIRRCDPLFACVGACRCFHGSSPVYKCQGRLVDVPYIRYIIFFNLLNYHLFGAGSCSALLLYPFATATSSDHLSTERAQFCVLVQEF